MTPLEKAIENLAHALSCAGGAPTDYLLEAASELVALQYPKDSE